jgi:hypothetical protein
MAPRSSQQNPTSALGLEEIPMSIGGSDKRSKMADCYCVESTCREWPCVRTINLLLLTLVKRALTSVVSHNVTASVSMRHNNQVWEGSSIQQTSTIGLE